MNVERFIYSRSLTADYRWIIAASSLTSQEKQFMERFLDVFKKYRFVYAKAPLKPLFCVHFPKVSALFTLQSGMFKDEFGRDIYSLEGICADRTHKKALWQKMPEIVGNYTAILNAWSDIHFPKADNLVNKPSASYALEDLLSGSKTLQMENMDVLPESPDSSGIIIIPFAEEGLRTLKNTVRSLSLSPSNFAFGCTAEMAREEAFRIIAFVDDTTRTDFRSNAAKSGAEAHSNAKNSKNNAGKTRFFTDEKWKKIVNKIRLVLRKK